MRYFNDNSDTHYYEKKIFKTILWRTIILLTKDAFKIVVIYKKLKSLYDWTGEIYEM